MLHISHTKITTVDQETEFYHLMEGIARPTVIENGMNPAQVIRENCGTWWCFCDAICLRKIIHTIIKAVPSFISLYKSKTPEKGKGIIKSGIASLTISGLLSTGKLSASGTDGTLLIILSILETIGYLYGMVAIFLRSVPS